MLKNRLFRIKRPTLHRAVPLTAMAAVMAATLAVTPSIASSFITPKQAHRTYLTRTNASNLYLKQKLADNRYLSKEAAHDKYLSTTAAEKNFVAKADLPPQPVGFVASSSADFGPVQSTTAVALPASSISFEVPVTSVVTLTFSGEATCVATAANVGCPIQLLVDEQPTGEVKSNFALSSVAPGPPALANTLTTTTVLTAGEHTASVQYAGATNATLNFGLKNWNYSVQAFPDLG